MVTVFDLLRQLVERAQSDPGVRISELQKRKAGIDREIRDIQKGHLEVLDATQIRERFQQMAFTARSLLSDFREVEQNFRSRIAPFASASPHGRAARRAAGGDLFAAGRHRRLRPGQELPRLLGFPDVAARQEELSDLLAGGIRARGGEALAPDRRLMRIHYDWLEAGEVAQRTVARLSDSCGATWTIRRGWRIAASCSSSARWSRAPSRCATRRRRTYFMEMDEPAPTIDLPMDRPAVQPPFKAKFAAAAVDEGDQALAADALFDQDHVDKARLMRNPPGAADAPQSRSPTS